MAINVARCRLTLHDNLFYASRELGRLYETEKYLHNYGLAYALGLVRSPYFNGSQVPRYQTDLAGLDWYVTPARPLKVDFAFNTFKMANVAYYSFTPQVVENRVVFGRAKELTPESTFEFFVIGKESRKLPRWVRLGKWMAKARLDSVWETINVLETTPDRPQAVDCPLNPLDIRRDRLFSYDVIPMPPVSLLANPSIFGRYCKLSNRRDTEDTSGNRLIWNDPKNYQPVVPLDLAYLGGEGSQR